MNKNKKLIIIISIITVLLVSIVGITFAFFNYTKTGGNNTVQAGRIVFNSTQTYIELENAFPTDKTNLDSTNSDTATITLTGDTTYSEGIEYKVTIEAVNNTINGKEVPISFNVVANNLGTSSSNYYTERGSTTNVYKLTEEGEVYNGKYVVVGYIKPDQVGVNGSINITAFIDTNKVVISDTYDGTESDSMGTTNEFVAGREVFTTSEWNSFQNTPLSFKVRVEAMEGIWVEPEKFLTMKNLTLANDSNWTSIRADITSIEFHKDGVTPENPITSFDVTDSTSDPSKGNITLYTVDDGLGTNTYKAIIVANDTIYAPEDSTGLFYGMKNLVDFDSKNFKVDKVVNMTAMFNTCNKLVEISFLSVWNVSNVTNMYLLFQNCSITNLYPLSNWDISNVENMRAMFNHCNLNNIDGISTWNVGNVTTMKSMFEANPRLTNTSSLNNWNIQENIDFTRMFYQTPSHPEFTKFPNGTWDSNGTFTPNA